VADELFAAHFSRGEDIADRTVLAAAGARAGLSPAAVATAAEDPELAAAVLSSLAEAHQLGITAVPTFVADRALGIAGAQPPDTLLALMQKAAEIAGTG
jgi:predicted DsbA family dithiol-disulfide isomerase